MIQPEVKQKAKEVNDLSFDYHLSHATLACDRLIEGIYKKFMEKKVKELSDHLMAAYRKNDNEKVNEIIGQKRLLETVKCHIFVDYIDMDENAGRVVKIANQLIISLPKKLLSDSRYEDGSYKEAGVKKLRQIMAHELGHIALHTEELLKIDSLQGSKDLDEQSEQEAEWFASELLELRHKRNSDLHKSGNYAWF
jgi:hypothetical protein